MAYARISFRRSSRRVTRCEASPAARHYVLTVRDVEHVPICGVVRLREVRGGGLHGPYYQAPGVQVVLRAVLRLLRRGYFGHAVSTRQVRRGQTVMYGVLLVVLGLILEWRIHERRLQKLERRVATLAEQHEVARRQPQ